MNKLGINAIIELIEHLRGDNGCPWDKKQTPETLALYLVEEVYELVEAIESKGPAEVCEELGDVLFHILFIAGLYKAMGHFDLEDVAAFNTGKMIRRHPHVFGPNKVSGTEEVRRQWHKIKLQEKGGDPQTSLLDSVPAGLPALMRAYRISERAAKIGFDWENIAGVIQKVEEEWAELKTALADNNSPKENQQVSLEIGDVFFTLVNVARFARIHPETALAGSTRKFEKRFKFMEKAILENGGSLESVSHEKLEKLWEAAKNKVG